MFSLWDTPTVYKNTECFRAYPQMASSSYATFFHNRSSEFVQGKGSTLAPISSLKLQVLNRWSSLPVHKVKSMRHVEI